MKSVSLNPVCGKAGDFRPLAFSTRHGRVPLLILCPGRRNLWASDKNSHKNEWENWKWDKPTGERQKFNIKIIEVKSQNGSTASNSSLLNVSCCSLSIDVLNRSISGLILPIGYATSGFRPAINRCSVSHRKVEDVRPYKYYRFIVGRVNFIPAFITHTMRNRNRP